MKRLVMMGAGGHGKMVLEAARPHWPDIVICDDAPALAGTTVLGVPIAGGRPWLEAQEGTSIEVIVSIGVNATRARFLDWLEARALGIATVIHPAAIISASADIGGGVFIAPGAILGSETRLARGVIINTGAAVDHDGVIGDCAHIGPGAHLCGNVEVGARSLIGVGASIAPGVKIGRDCVIGAGAAVVCDIEDGTVAVGVPARPVSRVKS